MSIASIKYQTKIDTFSLKCAGNGLDEIIFLQKLWHGAQIMAQPTPHERVD